MTGKLGAQELRAECRMLLVDFAHDGLLGLLGPIGLAAGALCFFQYLSMLAVWESALPSIGQLSPAARLAAVKVPANACTSARHFLPKLEHLIVSRPQACGQRLD